MFTFSIADIRAVLARGGEDAAANGGWRRPYDGAFTGEPAGSDPPPCLWLVGDNGVYVMSAGRLVPGERALVVHAAECDPATNPDWWHYKTRHYGGDEGADVLDAAGLETLIAAVPGATHLHIVMADDSITITPVANPH